MIKHLNLKIFFGYYLINNSTQKLLQFLNKEDIIIMIFGVFRFIIKILQFFSNIFKNNTYLI
jgi:hypothetical protein